MGKRHTYRFNPHTLKYEKVIESARERLRKISFSVLFGVAVGGLLVLLLFTVFDSPKERLLKREVAQMRRQVGKMQRHIDRANGVLDDLERRDREVYRVIFGAEPAENETPFVSLLGKEQSVSDVVRATSLRIDSLNNRLYAQSRSMDEVYDMARTKQERMSSMPAIMPMRKDECQIASGFGYRYHPILHYSRLHTGIDLSAHSGTSVYATGDGVVEFAGASSSEYAGYGVVCLINHGYGYKTLYAHLGKVTVKAGQRVRRGEQVGVVGSTGLAQGAHLHYEVMQNGNKVNPVYYFFNDLTPAEYEKVIELASQENQCLS